MDKIDDQGPATNVMHGRVLLFLRRNYFLVGLRDRQVVAAMPEHLLATGAMLKDLRPGEQLLATVKLRPRPRMARIMSVRRAVLCGY
jgi:hypothetical protein